MDAITPTSSPQRKSMDTGSLKKFAQEARRVLRDQVTAKLAQVLADNSAARREAPKALHQLEGEIRRTSRDQVIERVAYTWFNRFTALRFMDANGYTSVRVVTPAEGQTRPEILSEAMAGSISNEVQEAVSVQVRALLDNRTPSHDPQGEAYRLLLVATCNHWHAAMPFMFETIADYTELLMPEDMLSQGSILAKLREVMTEDACQDVEIIGWLYQFYISEKKDQVFAGLKKNVKITAENIPAATQLFTPHWIVRYLVENSLGRLWLLNRPGSKLAEQMDYYIAPEKPETSFLRIAKPEEIKVCDPACGSGHMLTYAFDLLYAIYEEDGYDPAQIPALILTHNLTGVEIDDRAGALAAFALTMKAAARLGRRRFLRMKAKPDICVLQNVAFTPAEMQDVAAVVGKDLFTDELRETLGQFEQAKNFGSLIVPKLRDPAETLRVVEARDFGSDLLLKEVQARVVAVLRMAEALSPKYHVVVANPPYMGGKGMNGKLGDFAKKNFPDSKSDLMTCFMERCGFLGQHSAFWGMINLPSWMFLGSYQRFRAKILKKQTIVNLLHLGRGIFGSDFGSVAFVINSQKSANDTRATYRRLFEKHVQVRSSEIIERLFKDQSYGHFVFSQYDFQKIPGSPIVYWVNPSTLAIFRDNPTLGEKTKARQGLATGDNDTFARGWQEVSFRSFSRSAENCEHTASISEKWFPYNKGGEFRRWFGNVITVVNWQADGAEVRNFRDDNGKVRSRPQNTDCYFQEGITWSDVTSGSLSVRYLPPGYIYDISGHSAFPNTEHQRNTVLGYLNTKFAQSVASMLNPTMHFQIGDYQSFPYPQKLLETEIGQNATAAVDLARSDWDAYETSWDFTMLPLLSADHRGETLEDSYARLRNHWQSMTDEMQRLEEENNRIFIDAYGLQDELTPEVPIKEITLTCNPAYRYGVKGSADDRETRLRADTMAEFLSYAVGCMFGRYSLDTPGLILANQGERLEDYLDRVSEPTFMPDKDNVIPVLDGDWFADDITERFRRFLRVTFGETRFQENLAFIEEALGKDIRKYFTRDFYNDHVKRYKKRPIYWMFSSPKGTFNALIYMHRYRPDTVSVLLNDYLREFRSKLEGYHRAQGALSISGDASPTQRTKALKEIEATARQIEEINAWERNVLFPLATQKIEIDLDDGVKANYPKFGAALKPIKGMNDADD